MTAPRRRARAPRPHAPATRRSGTARLRERLREAEQALEAIRTGEVESIVVDGPGGVQIYSLEGATRSYRALVEAMSEGAATLGLDGTLLYCNARFARMLAAVPERLPGTPLAARVAPGAEEALARLLREAARTEARAELSLRAEDGAEVPVLLSASAVADGGRTVLCLVATDLAERRRAEREAQRRAEERLGEALRAAERGEREKAAVLQHYRTLFELAPSGVLLVAPTGELEEFNEQAHAMLGYGRDEFSRRTLPELAAPEDRAELAAALRRTVARGGENLEVRLRARGGEVRHVTMSCRALEVDGGPRILATWRDFTDRKRMEDALREADRNKNEFLAMLSHELRNPLVPIRNCVYILENAPPSGAQAARAREVIERQTAHMVHLVEDLLDVTRISRGKIQLSLEALDLRDVVVRTVEDLRSAFEHAGVSLRVRVPDERVVVRGDRTRLAQVLGNLLHNAVKFTERGAGASVSLERDAERGLAVLRVRDQGAGIAPAMLPRLFEPFAQADETLDRSRGGLGLGLSLVRGLVGMHGGEVTGASDGPGQGSEFTIRLPLSGAAVGAEPGQAHAAGRARRVLVIEDNLDSAESLQAVLELRGHSVEVATSGPEGLERARAAPPEVVLCDIGLPGLDGFGVARALRGDPRLAGVSLVALSGYAAAEDVERALAAGFDRHLAKPVDLSDLDALLAEDAPARAARSDEGLFEGDAEGAASPPG